MVKGEGKTIITLVPERRILLYVMAMAGGVILAAAWPDDAAVGGMIAGLAYVLLSGMSVSAIRAFLMAMLVLAAWLSDRRNVGWRRAVSSQCWLPHRRAC